MPCAYSACHSAGLIYTVFVGGRSLRSKKCSGVVAAVGGNTVTVKLQVFVWPQASIAVQVTVVVPIGNVLPLGGLHEKLSNPQALWAELVKFTTAPLALVAVTVMFVEQVTVIGGRVTMTVKLQVLVWPHESIAVQVTVFVPIGKVLPEGGLQLTVGVEQPPVAELV